MNVLRYVGWVALAMAVMTAGVYLSGGNIWIYFDLPSILLVPIATIAVLRTSWSFGAMGRAFCAAFSDAASKEDMRAADAFFVAAGRIVVLAAGGGVLIGVINMMVNLENPKMLGPNLALALVGALYAIVSRMFVFEPMRVNVARKMANMGDRS
jgi:flagellar motor component MotA